jgi:hypothetical protein
MVTVPTIQGRIQLAPLPRGPRVLDAPLAAFGGGRGPAAVAEAAGGFARDITAMAQQQQQAEQRARRQLRNDIKKTRIKQR